MTVSFVKMKGSADKEMRLVLEEAHRLGWEIVRWTKHCQLRHPDIPGTLTVPGSPKNSTSDRKQMMRRLHKYPYRTKT